MAISSQGIVKHRNSNLELYRIIVMLLIIGHHYVVNSGLMEVIESHATYFGGEGGLDNDVKQIFYFLFGAWGKTGINCFVMITGYFMCKSKITLNKLLKLIFQIIFYNVVIFFVFYQMSREELSLKRITELFMPIGSIKDGFVSCFLIFYLSIPFLNKLVENLNKRMHQELIGLSLFVYTVWEMLGYDVSYNYVVWFSVLFFIASYIRIYGIWKDANTKVWGWLTLIVFLISVLSIIIPFFIRGWCTWFFVYDSNHIMALLVAVSSFMWFKNMKIKQNKIINTIASTTFGVFLIHANSNAMRTWLWFDICQCTKIYENSLFFLYSILSVFIVFILCSFIDIIRINTFENWVFKCIKKNTAG